MEEFEVDPNLECGICGMREFYEQEGFFYCSLCNTQSQVSSLKEFQECIFLRTPKSTDY